MNRVARIETHDLIDDDPKRGFVHAGEFFMSVRNEGGNWSNPGDPRLQRLAAAPSTFGNTGDGASGGFAVPIEFATEIADLSQTEDSLLPFCDVTPVAGNTMVFPRDETTPWGTTGARAYWQSEGTGGTQTKPSLRSDSLVLNKLLALVPVTNELSDDSPALGAYLNREISKSIRWKTNDSLLYGVGNGYQPLGVFNSSAQITVAKESGQATQTLNSSNITKMMARLPPGSFSRAIWLFNGDTLPAFFGMTAVSTIYWPAVGDSAGLPDGITAAFGLVVGRPALISPHAKSFSSQGDVILVDLSYVNVIQKAAGIQIATSMHLYFDADVMAFRASFRIDAQPKLTAPMAPANGSTQLSPFVQLGAR
jgi:HK97 family phage major capsid protein